jgi:hypothetical protein
MKPVRSLKPRVLIHVLNVVYGRLRGRVYGHPRYTHGTVVVTGPITRRCKNGSVHTKNTIYHSVSDVLY